MDQRLESIHGGGGSIKVGTIGTISALMTRELDSVKSAPQVSRVSVPFGVIAPKGQQPIMSLDEASSSGTKDDAIDKIPNSTQKMRNYIGKSHLIPMIGSENIALDRTPIKEKNYKRNGCQLVEIVDMKCCNPDRTWTNPIGHRLKKIGFSKLA